MESIRSNEIQLFLQPQDGRGVVDSNAIIRIQALSSYSKLYFKNGETMVVARTLRWFQERLPLHQFIRTHRSHVINKDFIDNDAHTSPGRIQLISGEYIAIARRRRKSISHYDQA